MTKKYRIDIYLYSCKNINDVIFEIKKSHFVEHVYFKRLFRKHYKKNTFIIDGCIDAYLNYKSETNYVFMSLESSASNFEKSLKDFYGVYVVLQRKFQTKLKLKSFLNESFEKLTYENFSKQIKEFYINQGAGSLS